MTDTRNICLSCASCGRELSVPLRWLKEDDSVCTEDQEPLTPEGTVASLRTLVARGLEWPELDESSLVAQRGSLQNVVASGERNGCCGVDGCDGPNLSCECGAVIGTERSDCWMPHFVVFEPGAVGIDVPGPGVGGGA